MRLLCFFDLPMLSKEDFRNYTRFRKALIKNGFIMLQESVYCKMLTTPTAAQSAKLLINNYKPPSGVVQILMVTENQFSKMEYIVGERKDDIVDSTERIIIL